MGNATINCIILDDEPLAVQLLEDYAQKTPQLQVHYAGSNPFEAMAVLQTSSIDLVFLDIQMPELTGMEIMQLFNKDHHFIITSAYQEYALPAYEFQVIDYLLKPVIFKRFYQSVEKYLQWRQSFYKEEKADYFFVKADRKHYKVYYDEVLYVEGLKDYIRIHTATEKIMLLENMKDMMEQLPQNLFIRVHRSYIVATDKVKLIDGNRIQLQNLTYIPIGETYRNSVSQWLKDK